MSHMDNALLASWGAFLRGLGEFAGAVVLTLGGAKSVPWIRRTFQTLKSKHSLVVEREVAVAIRDAALSEAAGTRRAVEDLKSSLGALKTRMDTLEKRLEERDHLFRIALRYIRTLWAHLEGGGTAATMPAPPPDLADDLDQQK